MTTKYPPLVSTEWLNEQLHSTACNIIILDATLDIVKGHAYQYNEYLKTHIPGAQHFDLNQAIIPRPTCARNLPDPTLFTEYARSLGINSNSHIIVYDSVLLHYSTKTWWIFKAFGHHSISVLDGGLHKWIKAGYNTVSAKEESLQPGNFKVVLNKSVVTEYEEMVQIVKNKSAQIVDSRRLYHFLGQEKEPCSIILQGLGSMNMPAPAKIQTGRMPGSVYISPTWVLDDNTRCFLPRDKLSKLFADHGVDLSKRLVTTCYMGHLATLICMAAELCEKPSSVYYGSWTEYGQLADDDLVTGPDTPYDGLIYLNPQ